MFTSFDNIGLLKVLNFLESHELEYLSGQDLSDVLKISRVAVWKHIKKIRSLGYVIESKQKRGYKFVSGTDKLLPWEVCKNLTTKFIGKRIYYFDEIDSTQNFALGLSTKDNENGTIVIAQKQIDGRGRLKRKWYSPEGGLWFSIIIKPKFEVFDATIVPIASSLALCLAIEKIHRIKVNVKWPNDITINRKKLAGMLVDANIQANIIENFVLGVGINFRINTLQMQKALKNSPNFYGVTSLFTIKDKVSQMELFNQFLVELEQVLDDLTNGKKGEIIKKWSKRTDMFGHNVTINTSKGKISGVAKKVDSDGALIIKTKVKDERIFVGDVNLD